MRELRVALRADASRTIGLGHIKRCLSLASALRACGAQVRLLARELGVDIGAMVSASGVELVPLARPSINRCVQDKTPHARWAEVDWRTDAGETLDALKDWRPDWVVVDHYSFDERWHAFVSTHLVARVGVIDDLADRNLAAEVVVDHNFSAKPRDKYRGRISGETALLSGPRFALLDPAYVQARPMTPGHTVRSIGIFMGGVDAQNLSSIVLRACREQAGFSGHIEIVSTRSNPNLDHLRALAGQFPNTEVLCDVPDLSDFFYRHDLQIGAGGGAVWERCRLGAPTLALIAAANQTASLLPLKHLGAVALPEPPESLDQIEIGVAIRELTINEQLRKELSRASSALVDGLGARRVALRLSRGCLSLRDASMEDARNMFDWRNAENTRRFSITSAEIDWDSHVHWLRTAIDDPRRHLLIASVGANDVGVIRFDAYGEGRAEVSLYLDPALHGLGLGQALLLAGERWLHRQLIEVSVIEATVLDENATSKHMFSRCGYHFMGDVWRKRVDRKNQVFE